jgi:hypothetical protein
MRVRKGGLLGRFVHDPAAPPAWWPAPNESQPASSAPEPVREVPEQPATDDRELEHEGGAVALATAPAEPTRPAESGTWLPESVSESPSEPRYSETPGWVPSELAPAAAAADDAATGEPSAWLLTSDHESIPAPTEKHKRRRLLPVLVVLALLAFAGVAAGVVVAVRSGTSHPATIANRPPVTSTPAVTSPPAAAAPVAKAKSHHRATAAKRRVPAKKHAARRKTSAATPAHAVVSAPAQPVSRAVTPSAPTVSSAPAQSAPPPSDPSVSPQQPSLPQAGAPTQTIGSGG